jgi:hypothetical protein
MAIDYKKRAEFWKAAAMENLDMLANANDEIKRLRKKIEQNSHLFRANKKEILPWTTPTKTS